MGTREQTPPTRLGQILAERGTPQAWLATKLSEATGENVSRQVVHLWVYGMRVPERMREPLAAVLGRNADELTHDDGTHQSPTDSGVAA